MKVILSRRDVGAACLLTLLLVLVPVLDQTVVAQDEAQPPPFEEWGRYHDADVEVIRVLQEGQR